MVGEQYCLLTIGNSRPEPPRRMIAPPASPLVSRGDNLSAVYLPPLCAMPAHLVDRKMQVVAANVSTPVVSVLPPGLRAAAFELSSVDRVVLSLEPARLDRAKHLLAGTEHSMLEIAHIVGYRTQAHFTRVFHEGTGTTPRRYRRDQRGQAGGRTP